MSFFDIMFSIVSLSSIHACKALTTFRYEEAKANGKDNYDRDLEDCLEKHIVECDRKIQRALKRLEDDDAGAATAIAVSEVTQVCHSFLLVVFFLGQRLDAELRKNLNDILSRGADIILLLGGLYQGLKS